MPGPAPSVYSPFSRCGMPQANSTTSTPRWMSPLASGNVLPCSEERSLASESVSLREQIEEFEQHARAALRVGRGPAGLRLLGIGDGFLDLGLAGERDLGLDLAGIGVEDVAEAAGLALDRLAADEMTDVAHSRPPMQLHREPCAGPFADWDSAAGEAAAKRSATAKRQIISLYRPLSARGLRWPARAGLYGPL